MKPTADQKTKMGHQSQEIYGADGEYHTKEADNPNNRNTEMGYGDQPTYRQYPVFPQPTTMPCAAGPPV
jgi:hypothetical protein